MKLQGYLSIEMMYRAGGKDRFFAAAHTPPSCKKVNRTCVRRRTPADREVGLGIRP